MARYLKRECKDVVLLDRLKNVNSDSIVFQNSRVYFLTRNDISENLRSVQKSQHPKSIMVWAGISSFGKTPLVFIPEGAKINAQVYKDLILEKHVLAIGLTFMKNKAWLFQQDGAPAHTAKISQDWLSSKIPGFLSP